MADVPERRSEGPESLLRGSSPPKAVRRRSSRRVRNGASRGGDLDENPVSFFVISPPHEPLESAPRISTPTPPQEPGFVNGADYIPFVDIQDEYDPDASSILNPKKRKLDARDREDRSVTKRERGGDRGGRDHLHTPWMRHFRVDPSDSVSAILHKEIKAFVNYVEPTSQEHEIRGLILRQIGDIAREIWPDAKAHAFGSFATKLYLPMGDIDIVLETSYVPMDNPSRITALRRLAKRLSKSHVVFVNRLEVIKARVPIVKFASVHARIPVDISINQTTGLGAVAMINRYLQHFPALRPLIVIIKLFLSSRGLNEVFKGGLGSYCIICMVISFIQMHPKIRLGEIDPSENLGVLLIEFFEFYGQYFNFNDCGICILNGGSYYQKAQRGWADLKQPYLMSVEDPTDPTNDIARGSFQVRSIRKAFAGAGFILVSRLLQLQEQREALYSGRYIRLQPKSNPGRIDSTLGVLIGVSEKVVEIRERIRNLYWSGSLHGDLHLQQPHTEVVSDETEEDMQFSDSSHSQEAESQADGVTKDATNLIIHPIDSNSVEEDELRPPAVSDDEGSRYHQPKPRFHRKVDRFKEREHMRSSSDSDDDGTAHHSSRRGEDGPPPKRRRTSQRHDVSPRVPRTTHESEGLKISSNSTRRREYWAGKSGNERAS